MELRTGDVVEPCLQENPTTGFQWRSRRKANRFAKWSLRAKSQREPCPVQAAYVMGRLRQSRLELPKSS